MIDGRELDGGDDEIAHQLELTRRRIDDLEEQLRLNVVDHSMAVLADKMIAALGSTREAIDAREAKYAEQAAARAERQQLRYLAHKLTEPQEDYASDDAIFIAELRATPSPSVDYNLIPAPTVAELASQLIARKKAANRGASHISELERSMGWLMEIVGADRPIDQISKAEMRAFRGDIERVDVSLRGQKLPFKARLTNDPTRQIKSATSMRYWSAVRALFSYAKAEFDLAVDPTDGLTIERKAGERVDSPEAFEPKEVARLLASPLYSGHASGRRYSRPGEVRSRGGHWWSGLLALFTGARAGELNQLLPTDFHFGEPIPFIRITTEDASGTHTKKVKNAASVRDIPIHPTLLALGLEKFIGDLGKRYPGRRVLSEFPLGSAGRRGEGLTRFWARYLRDIGLKRPGRATHVFRHTVTAALRAAGIAEEDVQAVLGHRRASVTAGYGGAYPLERKQKTITAIDYGFDVIAALSKSVDN